MNTVVDRQHLPDSETATLARASAEELSRLLARRPETDRARVQLDGRELVLPRHALALLRDLLTEMAQGNAVTILPTHAELTTQQAADILNVSRPYLVKCLEEGVIPFTRVGAHRRVRFEDLMVYKAERDTRSKAALDELVEQAQDQDLGY